MCLILYSCLASGPISENSRSVGDLSNKLKVGQWCQTNVRYVSHKECHHLLEHLSVLRRKAPQSKWSCIDRPNVRNLLVQMDYGPMDRLCYVNLGRPNGRRSSGPPMLRQFGPSKWTMVQWTTYVTSILTVKMDDGPKDRPCYANLDRPFGRSIGPPILRKF